MIQQIGSRRRVQKIGGKPKESGMFQEVKGVLTVA
jgi:hypothetical protein